MKKPAVLVTVPMPLRQYVLSDATLAELKDYADVTLNEDGHNWSEEELAERLPGVEAILASWGLAKLTEEVLAKADKLRIVAYGAGSVKGFVTDAMYAKGIVVTHAASRIAESVADMSLVAAMMGLRRPQDYDRKMKAGELWPRHHSDATYEITGKKVGLLGMGYVGRRSAKLFQGVGAEVWIYDPYVSAQAAQEMGVKKVELDELLSQCPVISVHLPITEETHHMLGARELALIQDGAVFVNTARSWVVDQEAMIEELSSGRFWAALDVFDTEPLPLDHPLRSLDNVLITPHVAGATRDSLYGLCSEMLAEIKRLFNGEPLKYNITKERLATMA